MIRRPRTGAWLDDNLLRHCAIRLWNAALKYFAGEELSGEYFVQQYVLN